MNDGNVKKRLDVKELLVKLKGFWKVPPKGRFLTLKETMNFGLYSLGVSFMMSAVNYIATIAFIPYFYKIDTIHAYIIVTLGSFVNLLLLPFIANLIEKTKTKWGRYKPFIIFSAPLFLVLVLMVTWIPQFEQEKTRIIYAYLTCAPVLVLSSFTYNMYQTMPTIITPNGQERADIMTPIGLIFGFAPSLLQIVAGPIRGYFKDKGAEYMGLRLIGIFSVVVGIVLILLIFRVKERVYTVDSNDDKEKIRMKDAFRMLSKNRPLIILCIALIVGSLREFSGQFRWLIIQFRFASDVKTAIDISGLPMTVIGFASTVAMFLFPIVTRKMNKNKIIILFSTLGVLSNAILGFVGYERIPVGTVSVVVVTGLHFLSALTPVYLLIPIMLGEIADNQQLLTGKRLDGHLQNLLFIMPVLFSQIFMIIAWFWQKRIGFEAKDYTELTVLSDAQQAVACQWFNAVSIISAVSGLLMIIVLLFYPLSKKRHAEIMEELDKIATLEGVCPDTRESQSE